jgi:hypothetical protein
LQDTAEKPNLLAPDGLAGVWAAQVVPFHLMMEVPAASQSEAVGHDTPLNVTPEREDGRLSSFHAEPFHASA